MRSASVPAGAWTVMWVSPASTLLKPQMSQNSAPCWKVSPPMVYRLAGRYTSVMSYPKEKQSQPMSVTPSGMTTVPCRSA